MADLPLHPRLARMVTGAIPLGLGALACAVAALIEDRDVLRGRPDDVCVDIAERVRLITEPGRRHPAADGGPLSSARRRAARLGRRVGVDLGTDRAPLAVDSCGPVLALAYPDRIAQAVGRGPGDSQRVGRGRFRLRSGAGAWVAEPDPLAGQAFLVIADLDADQRDSRIRLACSLDYADLESAAGAAITAVSAITWDARRDDLRETVCRRLDGLVLGATERKAAPGPDVTAALLQQVRATRLGALRWTDAARSLQQRVMFLRRTLGRAWPDLSDPAAGYPLRLAGAAAGLGVRPGRSRGRRRDAGPPCPAWTWPGRRSRHPGPHHGGDQPASQTAGRLRRRAAQAPRPGSRSCSVCAAIPRSLPAVCRSC
jgi:ATP-dependent helicase HrpB